jgi:peptidoglycan/LPS O-acetylase OafA/YrhL
VPKHNSPPGVGVTALLLAAAAASAVLAGTATNPDDAVARILFTIALTTLAGALMLARYRDRRAHRAQGDPSRGDSSSGG